jgi:G:T-mismatch repair DNA endonuclease (very short patch repair protein)
MFHIYIPKYNLLIEYNGDYWHCNPKKYEADYYNKKKNKTAKEIWEYDKNKLYLAKKYDYNCIVIWETDYKKNKNIIKEIFNNYEQIK